MVDFETFVIAVYVVVEPIVSQATPASRRRGRRPKVWPSEVVTLALLRQLARFRSERDFYRSADGHLRHLFPQLPDRSQLNRTIRQHHELLTICSRTLARQLGAQLAPYELLDGTVLPVRTRQRRGAGVVVESRAIGDSPRLEWELNLSKIRNDRLVTVVPQADVTPFFAAWERDWDELGDGNGPAGGEAVNVQRDEVEAPGVGRALASWTFRCCAHRRVSASPHDGAVWPGTVPDRAAA